MNHVVSLLLAWWGLGLLAAVETPALEAPNQSSGYFLLPAARVDGSGIYLDQIARRTDDQPLPHLLLAPAPMMGQNLEWTRAQIEEFLVPIDHRWFGLAWEGAETVRINRRTRMFTELEILELLTQALAEGPLRGQGDIDLRFNRPWVAVALPDEDLTVRVGDLPVTLSSNFIFRFEILDTREVVGSWQISTQIKLLRDVPVTRAALRRGQLLLTADVGLEKMDILSLRQPLPPAALEDPTLELIESVRAGQPLLERSVKVRPLVRRGELAEALLSEGAMLISIKVQVLEDGLPGQVVRVRNLKSRKEFFGKVQNEKLILVSKL